VKPPTILAAEAGLSKKRRWLAQKGKALELLTILAAEAGLNKKCKRLAQKG